jgi:hypothetical protein
LHRGTLAKRCPQSDRRLRRSDSHVGGTTRFIARSSVLCPLRSRLTTDQQAYLRQWRVATTTKTAASLFSNVSPATGAPWGALEPHHSSPSYLVEERPVAYPNQVFTVVIWREDRSKFGTPEASLRGKEICITGVIKLYRGRPEMVLHDPSELTQR